MKQKVIISEEINKIENWSFSTGVLQVNQTEYYWTVFSVLPRKLHGE